MNPKLTSILLCGALLAPALAHAVSADELVAKNTAARGGPDNLKAVSSVKWIGKIRFGDVEADYSALQGRPGSYRMTFSLQGFMNVYAWNGKEGWKIEPGGGRKDAERISTDDAKWLAQEAELEGLLQNYKAKGRKLEYLGIEDVDGTDAHKLKLTLPNGDFTYVFLDPDQFLEIKLENHRKIRGAEEVTETEYGEYEKVGGVFWPYSQASQVKDQPGSRNVVIVQKVELNVPLDEAQFKFPESPAKK